MAIQSCCNTKLYCRDGPAVHQKGGSVTVSEGPEAKPLLSIRGLTKFFGSFAACDSIDLDIGHGEIHALLGENGAGKSTLVKMLFGVLEPSAGSISWDGAPVTIGSPGEARQRGIGMVFQHFSLFEALTVAENIALSLDARTPLARIAEETATVSRAYGLPLDPSAHVADLSVGERQRIEIIRALLQNPKLIILDERRRQVGSLYQPPPRGSAAHLRPGHRPAAWKGHRRL
jgi:general nucleoside transport system ATP-binding protein